MGDEDLAFPPSAFEPHDQLVATLRAALTSPSSLDPASRASLISGLDLDQQHPERLRRTLSTLAAHLYARPDIVEATLVDRLADLVTSHALPDDIAGIVDRLFEFFASSPAAAQAWTRLRRILRDEQAGAHVRNRLLPRVADFVRWRADLVGVDGVLELAESVTRPDHRAFLLDHGIEPFVFSAPEAFTTERLARIATFFSQAPRYRYVLRFLAERRGLDADVGDFISDQLTGCFPLRATAAAILVQRPMKLLAMMNMRLGQGDEIVRLVPLLQALLDANPALAITLIARRTYLYDCPRVTTVPIGQESAVQAALAESFDGIIELYQPDRAELAHRFELHADVERVIAEQRPPFVIRAELGRVHKGELGIRSEFLYQSVQLDGREIAHSAGLDQPALHNIYEPCMRLLAELGLPQRVAEEAPLTPSLLIGVRSVDAERVWHDLVSPGPCAAPRPVALVNPFGGAGAVKGFHNEDVTLAAEIGGLVDEGFVVVVLPNGTRWGRHANVLEMLRHLEADKRSHVRVAPDPAETETADLLALRERLELEYADRIMRLFKYFATYADVVVTVEGWLAHLAYNLGRRLRLFLAAGSYGAEWFPYGRGPGQRLVTALSGRAVVVSTIGLSDPPSLPHGRRKGLLGLALSELGGGRDRDMEAVPVLRGALASADTDMRAWAVEALGRIAPVELKEDLLAALDDREPTVVRAAAEALLRGNVDCSREIGHRYRELLQAHVHIVRQEWGAVARIGPAAFPALFHATAGGRYVIAQQAKSLLRQMLRPFVRAFPAEASVTSLTDSPVARDILAGIVRAALTAPASLTADSLEYVADGLRLGRDAPEVCKLALAALAALFYARPDLVSPVLVERLADLLTTGDLPDDIGRTAGKLFEFLAVTDNAPRVWHRLGDTLRAERLDARTREWLLPVVGEFVRWREDIVGIDDILTLGRSPALTASERAFLLDHGVERFVFCAPEAFTVERLERIASLFADAPRYRHVLYSLAARRTLTPEVRAFLRRELAGRFPHQEHAAAILRDRPLALIVVLNVGMGQGDDVVRLVPLLQGLLDANPELSLTLVTWRPYLYDNPRVSTVPIGDGAALQTALAGAFDGVVEFFQPESVGFTFRLEAHLAIEDYVASHRPRLIIGGDLGRSSEGRVGNRLPFLYQTVRLDGEELAASCGLDDAPVRNIYDPTMRLLAELGLPQRAGEEQPLTASVLTGARSADAERIWADLVAPESGTGRRPVVLLNPFGGSGVTKGFMQQDEILAAEIAGLVDEGYRVVVLPNGQPWGRRAAILSVLSHLDAAARAHVRIAADPAETDEKEHVTLAERSELSHRDRVMRAFKYFAAYADLIVTVEGWLAHLAYNLGRPFRLFLAAGSFGPEYHPRNRGAGQRLVAALSTRAGGRHAESGLLREGDPPPLPHRPRKALMELALGALGKDGDLALLRHALSSPDADVRTWTIAALGRSGVVDAANVDLIAALKDRAPGVVREAADALLREGVDCGRELGARYRELLQAYADIARQNWDAVASVGLVALPALFQAGQSEVHDVAHGAKLLLGKMLSPFVSPLRVPEQSSSPSA